MRFINVVLISMAALTVTSTLKAQESFKGGTFANELAIVSGLPIPTTLTDLVTKSSSNSIKSGLEDFNYQVPNTKMDSTLIDTLKLGASAKGYILRVIELDPRFQKNVAAIQSQIDLNSLTKPSRTSGLEVSAVTIGKTLTRRIGEEIFGPVASESGSSATKNSIKVFGETIHLDIPEIAAQPPVPTPATASAALENNNGRVFGGTPIPTDEDVFPDSVAVVGKNQICSGVLVSTDTVITAGHCYCNGVKEAVIFGTSIITPLQSIPVDDTKSSVFGDCEQLNKNLGEGDVAVLRLQGKANVAPHLLGSLKQVTDAASVRAVGFGRTPNSIGFKYQVNIVIASHQCDGTGFSGLPDTQVYRCVPNHELVAAGLNRDTCGGDSGGPIYVFGLDNKPYLVGITSRSIAPDQGCGPGGIYVLLGAPPIREWLLSQGISFRRSL